MFPADWRNDEVRAKATPIAQSEVPRSLRLTKQAISKYPANLLKSNLKAVYLVRTLNFFGSEYGGTNSLDAVYLCNDGYLKGFTNRYLEQSFHHEFSSILLRNYAHKFPESKWRAANLTGTKYLGDGLAAVQQGKSSIVYSISAFRKGFLTEYAQASVEEDFNTVAEGLFLGDRQYWQAVDQYPALKRKCHVAIAFYKSLNSGFTEKKFRSYASKS